MIPHFNKYKLDKVDIICATDNPPKANMTISKEKFPHQGPTAQKIKSK